VKQTHLRKSALARRIDSGAVEGVRQAGAPQVAADEEVAKVRERRVIDGVNRARCRQDGDLPYELAPGFREQAPHVLIDEQPAQDFELGRE
jgi:hypothetical protein